MQQGIKISKALEKHQLGNLSGAKGFLGKGPNI